MWHLPKAVNKCWFRCISELQLSLNALEPSAAHELVQVVRAGVGFDVVGLPKVFLREASADSRHQKNET
jgi:hypothetical protein